MTRSNKEIVLEVLRRTFVDRDPTVVEQYFDANYKQHNHVVMVHGRYVGWGPKPMIAVDIFRVKDGRVVEDWDVMQEEVLAANTASGNAMFTKP